MSDKALAVESVEELLDRQQQEQEREVLRRLLMTGFDTCLTATQRRRLWLYCVDGLTVRQIADAENVAFQNIAKAISAATKKLKRFFEKQGDKNPISAAIGRRTFISSVNFENFIYGIAGTDPA